MAFRSAFLLCLSILLSGFFPLCANWQSPPEQFTTSGAGFTPDVAANDNGDAMAVWIDGATVKASQFTAGTWGAFTAISTNAGTNFSSKVAFDDSGNALAIWATTGTPDNSVHSAFFNGTSWSEPAISPLDSSTNVFQSPVVAMDGAGNGISAWIELTANEVRSSTFSFSFWNAATTIGTGNGTVSIAENKNDAAVAVWTNGGVVTANHFASNAWHTATAIGSGNESEPGVGIASSGNALAIWLENTSGAVMSSRFNGTSWSTPQALSTANGNTNPTIGVAPGGTAVAVWIDSSNAVQSSIYNGTSWSAPTRVSSSPLAKQADVTVASNGNAMAVWAGLTTDNITEAALPLGGSWEEQQTVGTFSNPPNQVVGALSTTGTAFAVWIEHGPGSTQNAFGAFNLAIIPPTAPVSISGKVRVNSFASQYDRLHVITFQPSTDTSTTFYRLRRNGTIIAELPGIGPFNYVDHNRSSKQLDVYTLTAVDAGGLESTPLTVSLK